MTPPHHFVFLCELGLTKVNDMEVQWLQVKGDPAQRARVFEQERAETEFDRHIARVLAVVQVLVTRPALFQVAVDFSTNQLTCWSYRDPFRYQVHVGQAVLDPSFVDRFPAVSPAPPPTVPATAVPSVLAEWRRLRFKDKHVYLRSASLNVASGLVSLHFSCGGAQYLPYPEFWRLIALF